MQTVLSLPNGQAGPDGMWIMLHGPFVEKFPSKLTSHFPLFANIPSILEGDEFKYRSELIPFDICKFCEERDLPQIASDDWIFIAVGECGGAFAIGLIVNVEFLLGDDAILSHIGNELAS